MIHDFVDLTCDHEAVKRKSERDHVLFIPIKLWLVFTTDVSFDPSKKYFEIAILRNNFEPLVLSWLSKYKVMDII